MEHIINRVALDNDLPVSKVREDMVAAIHEAAQNPTEDRGIGADDRRSGLGGNRQ